MNYGMQVTITYNENSHMGNIIETLNNVTEIHYNYTSVLSGLQIAFESDIHETGCTKNVADIDNFEAIIQNEKVVCFQEKGD